MTDPTIAAWSRENDLLFQLRQLREENERLKKEIANQDAMLERQTARIVELQEHIENFDGEDRYTAVTCKPQQ
jgi:predicted  nucleic acid-binding Zn-ribbon protein